MQTDSTPTDPRGPLFTLLQRLSHLNLTGKIHDQLIQRGHGGYSDVFLGSYMGVEGRNYKVAVKKLRIHIMKEEKFQKRLAKELYLWSKLQHSNILPLKGFYIERDMYPHLVSPWMEKGSIMSFMKSNPSADVLSLIRGIAEGLQYLHVNGVVHSDIKPDNVLVSDSGEALLCDFGISSILESSMSFSMSMTCDVHGTIRYMAKEILDPEGSVMYCREADVWAFGMTVYTIVSRRVPYHSTRGDAAVLLQICSGKLPLWLEDNEVWPPGCRELQPIVNACWRGTQDRPTMDSIISRLDTLQFSPAVKRLYVMRTRLRFNTWSAKSSYLMNRKVSARIKGRDPNSLIFAALHWADDFSEASKSDALCGALTDFLYSPTALYWVEFLSLIGGLETGKAALQRCIEHFKDSDRITHAAREWHIFISDYYDAISISTPHVYISVLSWGVPTLLEGLREKKLLPSTDECGIAEPQNSTSKANNKVSASLRYVWCSSHSPDGSKLASGHQGGNLRIWNAVTGELIHNVKAHDGHVFDIKFSPDGSSIITGSTDKSLKIWDARSGEIIWHLKGHTDRVRAVAYSPNGKKIGSGSADMTLRIWDAQSGDLIGKPLKGHVGFIIAVAFSPDGATIASGSYDRTVRIWDLASAKQVGKPLRGHDGSVWCVAYSSDGNRIVSASDDKTLRVWDAKTGGPVGDPMKGHKACVYSVAYTPDGRRIVSGSVDNTLRIWNAASHDPIGVIARGESRWDSGGHCFLSFPSYWRGLYTARIPSQALIPSDAPYYIPVDGWLRTLDGGLFLWVPSKYRKDVCCRGPTGRIPPRMRFDWKKVPHGKDWMRVKEMIEGTNEQ